ncbi:MAG: cytochrome c peroxidase [Pseudomonadota bacterium]
MLSGQRVTLLVLTLLVAACGGGGGGSSDSDNSNAGGGGSSGGGGPPPGPSQAQLEALGEKIFQDTNLSNPPGQSCETCHDPAAGFADPDSGVPVSEGVIANRFGTRNSPTVSYAAFIPLFTQVNNGGNIISRGGHFLDGRQPRLEEQAQQPFLSAIEMNMTDRDAVITAIQASTYAADFTAAFGADIFNDVNDAYVRMSEAIAAFERSDALSPFTSKFDQRAAGSYTFTAAESAGEIVFDNVNCDRCHSVGGPDPIFTNFQYENIGVPANSFVLANSMDASATLVGNLFVDNGLGGVTLDADDNGKFRTPTLRNAELTAPYMHNGVFNTLAEVIDFYNNPVRPTPEVAANVTTQDVGNLGMTAQQMLDLEAFLLTLTDQ